MNDYIYIAAWHGEGVVYFDNGVEGVLVSKNCRNIFYL